eukprot:UN03504
MKKNMTRSISNSIISEKKYVVILYLTFDIIMYCREYFFFRNLHLSSYPEARHSNYIESRQYPLLMIFLFCN